jgi:spore maturation protein CgeB
MAFRFINETSPNLRKLAGIFGTRRLNESLIDDARQLNPDMVLVIKGTYIFDKTIARLRDSTGATTAIWFPDDPRYFRSLSSHLAQTHDFVFTTCSSMIARYKEVGANHVEYLAFGCDPELAKHDHLNEQPPNLDLVFIGTFDRRRESILRKMVGLNLAVHGKFWKNPLVGRRIRSQVRSSGAYGSAMFQVYKQSKMVLDVHRTDELKSGKKANMRVFEATANGSFLFTDLPSGLDELFAPGREVGYYHEDDVRECAEYYLRNEEERKKIALKGRERALTEHTYDGRMKKLLETCGL